MQMNNVLKQLAKWKAVWLLLFYNQTKILKEKTIGMGQPEMEEFGLTHQN